jgi:hypothetical protein
MTIETIPAAAEQEARKQETPLWLRFLSDWKALAWPLAAALLAAICNFFGFAALAGERAVLGVDLLDRPAVSEGYIIVGAATLAELVLFAVFVMMVAIGLRAALVRLIFHGLPDGIQGRICAIPNRAWWGWTVVFTAVATASFGLSIASDLLGDPDSMMILKPAKDLGIAWLRISLDQVKDWLFGYLLLMAAVLTIFIVLSWWILTRFFMSIAARITYGALAIVLSLLLMSIFGLIFGAGFTVLCSRLAQRTGTWQRSPKLNMN